MKSLNDILKQASDTIKGVRPSKTEPLSLGKDPGVDYKPKAPDEQEFVAKHSVQKWDDPNGNKSDVFQATNIKYTLDRPEEDRHGRNNEEAKKVNESSEEPPFTPDAPKQKRPNEPTTAKGLARKAMRDIIAGAKKKAPVKEAIAEKHLTPAELKKRGEVAQAIERKNPKMPMSKKMAIATATAKKVAEDLAMPLLGGDQEKDDDESAEMAKSQLRAICDKASHLIDTIPDEMIIEPWVQSKIAQAVLMINGVHDYMLYRDKDKPTEQMDTPMTFPNMSVDVNTGQNV